MAADHPVKEFTLNNATNRKASFLTHPLAYGRDRRCGRLVLSADQYTKADEGQSWQEAITTGETQQPRLTPPRTRIRQLDRIVPDCVTLRSI
jgi:hypothetical protein